MRLVVADTAPLNYLVLIGQAGVLASLFGNLLIQRLKATSFRCRPEIMDALLAQHLSRERRDE